MNKQEQDLFNRLLTSNLINEEDKRIIQKLMKRMGVVMQDNSLIEELEQELKEVESFEDALYNRMSKLEAFLETDKLKTLPHEHQRYLISQSNFMYVVWQYVYRYEEMLKKRIKLLKREQEKGGK